MLRGRVLGLRVSWMLSVHKSPVCNRPTNADQRQNDLSPRIQCGWAEEIRHLRLELAGTMPLTPMAAVRDRKVRTFVKETVGNLLINERAN